MSDIFNREHEVIKAGTFHNAKGENTMLRNKKRNNINSTSCYNSSAFDTGRSKYKFNIR